ncbi:MAG: hypothetical protein ACPLVJ_00740 [Candidatus Bathyarchaeales archaeon]
MNFHETKNEDATTRLRLEDYLRLFFEAFHYATPKQIMDALYPIFKHIYAKDTFRRLMYKSLKRIRVFKHPLRPFYCHPKYVWELDFIVKAGWFKLLNNPRVKEAIEIIDVENHQVIKYSLLDYLFMFYPCGKWHD